MNRSILLLVSLTLLAACGVKRPLMTPSQIPAYERARREKLERLEVKPEAETTEDRATKAGN